MAKIGRFEDMEVWQQARMIVKKIYSITCQGKFSRDFGLREQIQRAAISIMSNIAEGFERGTNKEFIQFLFIAKGSAGEVRSQLYIALDLGYIEEDTFNSLNADLISISSQISGFIQYLKSSEMRGTEAMRKYEQQILNLESDNLESKVSPVECLGMTFPDDEDRRKYFLKYSMRR